MSLSHVFAQVAKEGAIAPEPDFFHTAVNNLDLNTEFSNDAWYANQVDIYSDQLVAIEAIRLLLVRLQERVERAEGEITENDGEIAENLANIHSNTWDTLQNAADISTIELDILDLEACLERQEREEQLNREVLELYCHSQAYVEWIMPECERVLVGGTRLSYGFTGANGEAWTDNLNPPAAVKN